jgi:hypothetical protein
MDKEQCLILAMVPGVLGYLVWFVYYLPGIIRVIVFNQGKG